MGKADTSTRDRAGTERTIIDAAKAVLVERGFSAFGVNAIAREAGCDKQLIYRYFGGLDGLVEMLGREMSEQFGELLAPPDPEPCASYAAFIEHMLLQLLAAFRKSDLLLRIAAWEIADPSPVTRQLALARGQALAQWVRQQRGTIQPPAGLDVGAINATLIAAVQHLALAGPAVGEFGGMRLKTDEDWERIATTLRAMVRAVYSDSVR